MMRDNIFIGYAANDGSGDTLRVAFTKTNNNFIELYSNTQYVNADYALKITDVNQMLYVTAAGLGARIYIPNTGQVPFPDGTIIRIISNSTGNVVVSPNGSVSLYKSGNGVSANRNVTTYSVGTLYSPTSNVWYIEGNSIV